MNVRDRSAPETAAALLAALLVVMVSWPLLNGCVETADEADITVIGERYPLSEDGVQALARFDQAYAGFGVEPGNSRQLKHFRDAYRRIRASYVAPVTDAQLIDAAIEGMRSAESKGEQPLTAVVLVDTALDAMTASLDPHSIYLDPQELREAELATTGEFGGLGIQVTRETDAIRIISPIEDTPAERAGLKPGDLITHVDGKPVADMKLVEAVRAMRGEPGTRIRLAVRREGGKAFDVVITRAVIAVRPVRWRIEDDVIYVRVANFNEKTGDALAAAFDDIRRQQATAPRGVVLDLRNNPGGLFDQSLHVADAFLDDGVIVTMRGRENRRIREFHASAGDLANGLPMVVLINGGSASASEIVASALQDHGRAVVMGTQSFGKGSVQTVMRLPVEGALKLTTALYYAPSGQAIQARGVLPDIELEGGPIPPSTSREFDLPHALPAVGEVGYRATTRIDVTTCPPDRTAKPDDQDPELGCAVALLRAESPERFVRTLAVRPTG